MPSENLFNPIAIEKRAFNKRDHRTNLQVKNFEVSKILAIVDTNLMFGTGHSSLLFLNDKNQGICYNTSLVTDIFGALAGKDVDYKMNRVLLNQDKVMKFINTGKLILKEGVTDKNKKTIQNEDFLVYTKYVSMPVKTKKAGKAVLMAADDNYRNPGKYNLYERNCNHIVQEALKKSNLDYAPTKGNFKELKQVFEKFTKSLFRLSPAAAKKIFEDSHNKAIEHGMFPSASLTKAEDRIIANGSVTGDLPMDKHFIKPMINFLKTKMNAPCDKVFIKNVIDFYDRNKNHMSQPEQQQFTKFVSRQRHIHSKLPKPAQQMSKLKMQHSKISNLKITK